MDDIYCEEMKVMIISKYIKSDNNLIQVREQVYPSDRLTTYNLKYCPFCGRMIESFESEKWYEPKLQELLEDRERALELLSKDNRELINRLTYQIKD